MDGHFWLAEVAECDGRDGRGLFSRLERQLGCWLDLGSAATLGWDHCTTRMVQWDDKMSLLDFNGGLTEDGGEF